ncbi:uncharacterized protein J8A68_000741 [[Candida] subhashii]|uniref:BHLH domain-containing protein n=1 Tax=[Candida] subhashii TaxID=561895 RepID=A0A8J5QJ88_9ASCO|nr:uncharacterized protein J8A68_000741 [[Candida] subhashii]KAG7665721.1 hypothetical protein J8A68_000741 [[Candida] subhashii]
MTSSFPNPPLLKTTIIQLNKELDPDDNNYEILTNEYNKSNSSNGATTATNGRPLDIVTNQQQLNSQQPNKKKRRRSSVNVDSEELAKRKHETKQLHSIIEKRRRIKINREFEALKYLIPACRSTHASTNQANNKGGAAAANNNNNKIDGMYKLTILKSSVEYILYLHHIIRKQHELLSSYTSTHSDFSIDFAKIPLDVNQYRNIDKDFNFNDLLQQQPQSLQQQQQQIQQQMQEQSYQQQPYQQAVLPNSQPFYKTNSIAEEPEEEPVPIQQNASTSSSNSSTRTATPHVTNFTTSIPTSTSSSIHELPKRSPNMTPETTPILTMLNKYTNIQYGSRNSYSPQHMGMRSTDPSPFTNPLKSTLSFSPSMLGSANLSAIVAASTAMGGVGTGAAFNNNQFILPDPAINPNIKLEVPKQKVFKPVGPLALDREDSVSADQDAASKTLLSLKRKSSIDRLLN